MYISNKILLSTSFVAGLLILSACHKDDNRSKLKASAGFNQNVMVGQTVTLNGKGSTDSQDQAFSFEWEFVSKPDLSNATFDDNTSETPVFTADVQGKYKIQLAVSNKSTSRDTVIVAAFKVKNVGGTYVNITPGPNVGIRDFAAYKDTLYATCEFTEIGGIQAKKVAGYNGSKWFAMKCGLENGSIYDMIGFKGELYVTGKFDEIGCIQAKNIARWDGINWHEVEGGLSGGDNPYGHALEIYNGELYIGGQFKKAGDVSALNIAKWDGSVWSSIGSVETGSVRELRVYRQKLFAGGYFSSVNGLIAAYIAAYDGSGWSAVGIPEDLELQSTGVVKHMAVLKDKLYISGDFSANTQVLSELVVWDGDHLSDFGRAFSLYADNTISELTVINDILYIGGTFNNVVGTQSSNIIQWDGDSWGIMSTGISGTVLTIEQYNGQIYIGGDFDAAGGHPAEDISIWTEE